MPTPVVIVTANGRPVTNVAGGIPMTPVSATVGGEPVIRVEDSAPVTLVNEDLTTWEAP